MRKVYVEMKVLVILRCNENVDVSDVVNELDYSFADTSGKANVEDTEILDYNVVDSK